MPSGLDGERDRERIIDTNLPLATLSDIAIHFLTGEENEIVQSVAFYLRDVGAWPDAGPLAGPIGWPQSRTIQRLWKAACGVDENLLDVVSRRASGGCSQERHLPACAGGGAERR